MVEPLGRRGSCSFVHNEKFYLFHGYNGPHDRQREQGLYSYDLRTAEWSEDVLDTTRREKHVVSGEAFALVRSTLYTFGGWWDGERNSRVRELDLDTFRWREYTPNNPSEGPMHKDKAGMVAYGDEMLCVFGGYGEAPSVRNGIARQRGAQYDTDMASVWGFCWTNELHLFHLKNCELPPFFFLVLVLFIYIRDNTYPSFVHSRSSLPCSMSHHEPLVF